MELEQKRMLLKQYFTEHNRVVLGFSGGVDSAFLLAAAQQAGAAITPIFIKTPFQPAFELADAKRLADQLDIPLEILEADPLTDQQIAGNDARRCYWCKRMLFSLLRDRAQQLGATLIDGTNASDPEDDRPGMQALRELGAQSPLRLCGLTKEEIRQLSREYQLFTWDKPSYACLATRIPTGTPIDSATLQKIEGAEQALVSLGFSDFRVRVFHGAVRLQLLPSQWQMSDQMRQKVTQAVNRYFDTVLLDMVPRTSRE